MIIDEQIERYRKLTNIAFKDVEEKKAHYSLLSAKYEQLERTIKAKKGELEDARQTHYRLIEQSKPNDYLDTLLENAKIQSFK